MYIFQVVSEDAEESTTDGYEIPIQHHYDTIEDDDEYESMNRQHNQQRQCDEPIIHSYITPI